MKKASMVILALVMALTMVMGSFSPVNAANPHDAGQNALVINYFYDQNGNQWLIVLFDSYNSPDFSNFLLVYEGTSTSVFNTDDIISDINWKKGIATFQNANLNFTVTFSPQDVTSQGSHQEKNYITKLDNLSANVAGTVTSDSGTVYTLPSTNVSTYLYEYHTIVK
jgi:hypothetical protein